ncbi:MAG TPA: MMPL family transporter [Gaiellales bacterium]|nr:MMPL family transporter [Gaiellales bacterium]
MHAKHNLAHRMGRWSGTHPWTAILGWMAFVVVSFFIGTSVVSQKTLKQSETGVGESGHAARVLDKAFPTTQTPAGEMILVQTRSGRLATTDLNAVARDVRTRVGGLASVTNVQPPQRSHDGRAALIRFDIRGDSAKAGDRVAPIEAAVSRVANEHPGLRVEEFGDASSSKKFDDKLAQDFKKAEFLSIPITLIILLLAFGALLAAGIPILLGLTSVFTAFGLTAVSSQFMATGESTQILMMLIGMAVAVDYSLFYLKREREERARGAGKLAALEAAASTSGHAVLISGLTVMASLAGIFFMGEPESGAMAIGSILVVGVAVLGSLTVLPAVLAKLGDRVHKSRLPLLSRLKREERDSRVWGFVLGHVMRRPVVALVGGVAILVVLALPALGMHTKQTGTDDISRKAFPVLKVYDHIQESFPSEKSAAVVVIQARDVRAADVQAGIADLKRETLATGKVLGPIAATEVSRDGTVAHVDLPLVGDGSNNASMQALDVVRQITPTTIGAVPGTKVDIGGDAATTQDQNDNLSTHAPLVFGFVLAMAFLLLLVTFRSIVIPIKAIMLNLLSVAAAFGVLTMVFQHGFGEIIGMPHTKGIAGWLPVFLFVILFGLSMDYHVFILSRIKEGWDKGLGNDAAVEQGIRGSAGVVTAAAAVMVAVFSIFATLSLIDLQEFGVGLAVAIAIDATLIRGVVLPSAMKLLGKWNWYMPRSLGWLPSFSHGEGRALRGATA